MDVFDKILQLLAEKAGFDPETFGVSLLEKTILEQMQNKEINDFLTYYKLLLSKPEVLKELIVSLTIPETWFMRDKYPFDYLKDFAKSFKLEKQRKLKIASMPCSTGEEPYSIAISLIDAGLDIDDYYVDAYDINPNYLQLAKLGHFRKISFRTVNQYFIDKHFIIQNNQILIKPKYRDIVNFLEGNIVSPSFAENKITYDVIFFRNLLIYLNQKARETVLENIKTLLSPEGILFVGHSEIGFFLLNGFKAINYVKSFACTIDNKQAKALDVKVQITKLKTDKPRKIELKVPPKREIKIAATDTKSINYLQIDEIDKIKLLADKGSLSDAETKCNELLIEYPTNHEAYFVLGLICQALNKSEDAEINFNKCLYLYPNHYEAMIHLSLIYQNKGDVKKADLLKIRADKLFLDK